MLFITVKRHVTENRLLVSKYQTQISSLHILFMITCIKLIDQACFSTGANCWGLKRRKHSTNPCTLLDLKFSWITINAFWQTLYFPVSLSTSILQANGCCLNNYVCNLSNHACDITTLCAAIVARKDAPLLVLGIFSEYNLEHNTDVFMMNTMPVYPKYTQKTIRNREKQKRGKQVNKWIKVNGLNKCCLGGTSYTRLIGGQVRPEAWDPIPRTTCTKHVH